MKTLIAAVALAALVAGPAVAQNAAETITKAATDAAAQAAADSVKKAAGGDKHKNAPNYGQSEDHRQDGEHGHKGKAKEKSKKK